jgi:hypothetical protein
MAVVITFGKTHRLTANYSESAEDMCVGFKLGNLVQEDLFSLQWLVLVLPNAPG